MKQSYYMYCTFYLFFHLQLASDTDPNVKSGADLLDRLVKVNDNTLLKEGIAWTVHMQRWAAPLPSPPLPQYYAH
jgi:hypothetical protein